MIERMVIGEHIGDEWTINFGEYNHETDVTIPKSFALELLKIKEEFNRLKAENERLRESSK